ncbi:MAG: hypothetical protein F4169_20915 [Gammaproteobacteria bacterium]|nr:hypothetical protein [Gammaproteobacteria bacterium]
MPQQRIDCWSSWSLEQRCCFGPAEWTRHGVGFTLLLFGLDLVHASLVSPIGRFRTIVWPLHTPRVMTRRRHPTATDAPPPEP